MSTYAKDINGVLQYPTSSEFPGIPNWETNDRKLRKKGYLPLIGEPEKRDGFSSSPSSWHFVQQSTVKIEPRQKNGTMENVPITVDASYIQVDEWSYTEIIQVPDADPMDDTDFKKACKMFRDVCAQIGRFIGENDFQGGFDDYERFITSSSAKNSKASASLLASMWSGANEYCKYEASKIGYGQPEWWYKCWEYTDEDLNSDSE